MSPSEERASDAALGEQEQSSVYNFLYHDVRRVGSFLAQFDPSGHLTSLKQTESAESTSAMKFSATAGASAIVARGGAAFEDQRSGGEREMLERAYDPLWTNAREFLDFLASRNMIRRRLTDATIGQFVLVGGHLMMLDLAMVKTAWDNPTIRKVIQGAGGTTGATQHNRQQRRAEQRGGAASVVVSESELGLALLNMLPHTLQCRLIEENVNVWCSLDEEYIVGKARDIVLKRGVLLQGRWQILGILDAYPDQVGDNEDERIRLLNAVAGTIVGQLLVALSPSARAMLGRPPDTYGMTPLLIFREIIA